ncbi:ATP-dependent RNA helicase DDX24 isoform X2 [Lepidochelys kempii]|uniref:ATP-dependent RNA helicase DDX24 isoform X2 n=1 Tax=Lepidochelys kempii TaxID=8472 RepID=UPI003C6F2FF9
MKTRNKFKTSFKLKQKGIKVVGKWKPIEIDPNLFADEQLGDLVCFEELTDYKLVNSSKIGKEKEKKRKSDSVSEEEEEDSTIQKKKRKKEKELGTRASKNYNLKVEQDEMVIDQEDKPKDTIKLCGYEEDECESGGTTTTEKTSKKKKKKKVKKKVFPSEKAPLPAKSSKKVKNWTTGVLSASSDQKTDVSAWKDLFVPKPVLQALSYLGFSAPTPIQALALPSAIRDNMDVLGAAETGIQTAILVGGMAAQKQERVLNQKPEIVIATPGRLWELIKEKHSHLSNLRQLRCLVIDEADRMVERGHFLELSQLLEMLNDSQYNPRRQTFVFSATLTLVHQAPTRVLQKKYAKKIDQKTKLEMLMEKVGIRGKPKVIDLTRKESTVETLTETRIHCDMDDKDYHLYYFLLQYPGRTMVFANSIDCIKRLSALLTILDCNPLPLHANMHQKQRLKNLERFAERENCVLLTTDVAARGLDIPNVQHVIHYQVPRTSEIYVHRSGRTARAANEGLSLLLIGPDDMINFRKIYKTLEKNEELPFFPVETKCMFAIKERVNLARQIEKVEYYNSRAKQHNSWFQQAAEALEIDLDDDVLIGGRLNEQEESQKQKMLKGMKKQLKHLLSQPVFKVLLKTKYPTQSGKLLLPHSPVSNSESALSTISKQQAKRRKKKKKLITD